MDLAQWSEETGILPTHPTTERLAVSVTVDQTHPRRPELWRLTDYRVSSSCGPVVWLSPVQTPQPTDDEPECELCGSTDDELVVVWTDDALPSRLLCCSCAADDLVAETIRRAE